MLYLDDIAIAEAIHEVEQELQGEERKSLFKPEDVLTMDLNDIDSNLKQISPTLDDYMANATGDAATVEGKTILYLTTGSFDVSRTLILPHFILQMISPLLTRSTRWSPS